MRLGIADKQLGIVRRSNWLCTAMYCFKWDTTQINSSSGYASSSMGARCFPGLVVLSLSPIVNTVFPGSSWTIVWLFLDLLPVYQNLI